MNQEIIQGLGLLAIANISAFSSNYTRIHSNNYYVKESSALIEVISHAISYSFYADIFIDEIRHSIDAKIVGKANEFNPTPIILPVPYIGELMNEDIKDIFEIDNDNILFKALSPYLLKTALNGLRSSQAKPIFDYLDHCCHLPELLPGMSVIGFISAITYNLINIPVIGEYINNNTNGALDHIEYWRENPGGETHIGCFYRNYILYGWEKIHKLHHFYEEFSAIDRFIETRESPIMAQISMMGEYIN